MSVWRDDVVGWGRSAAARHRVSRPSSLNAAAALVAAPREGKLLGYGQGRSYGDQALNPDGELIDCGGLDRFISFDRTTGVLACEAGVRLADILAVLCRPEPGGGGWFLPVSPGTRFITVGGAIANDVHGKNHHRAGTFGRHVRALELARSDGSRLVCTPEQNAELFAATIGGMGLTGLVLRATIQMRRVDGLAVEAEDIRFDRLEQFFELVAESDTDWEYTAAWIDSLASGRRLGRGVFSRARHHAGTGTPPPSRAPRLGIPVVPPFAIPSGLVVRAFNGAYWRKLGPGRTRSAGISSYEPVLYPLDAVGDWNRVYGPRGFYQFQCVVPIDRADAALRALLDRLRGSGQASALSVLKVFGEQPSPGLMSFPLRGASLTFDLANFGDKTRELLALLEAVVITAGGRIYLAKDSCMSAASLRAGYANFERFRHSIDPMFSSALARRLAIVDAVPPGQDMH